VLDGKGPRVPRDSVERPGRWSALWTGAPELASRLVTVWGRDLVSGPSSAWSELAGGAH